MAAPFTALQRQRILLYLRVLAVSGAIGAVFGAVVSGRGLAPSVSILVGIANGGLRRSIAKPRSSWPALPSPSPRSSS